MVLFSFLVDTLIPAQAQILWNGATGDWNTGANWVGGIVPTAADDFAINNGGTAQLSAAGAAISGAIGSGATDSGTLQVLSGGVLTNSASLFVGRNGSGTLQISGTGSVFNTLGRIAAGATASTGLAQISGGTWTNSSSLDVGYFGNGTLEISGTGSVSNTIGIIGNVVLSTGRAVVSGGTWTNSGNLAVGLDGNGTLEISGTGSVSNTIGIIGLNAGSTGLATVSGGNWTNSGQLQVGVSGNGTLGISGTGNVSSLSSFIGLTAGSTGLATVSGGNWTNSGNLIVGNSGNGTLEINGTGSVSNTTGLIGNAVGSTGLATVSGGTWTNSVFLLVGHIGNGTLQISGTGSVSNTNGSIGDSAGSTGLAEVSGGSWANSTQLSVGSSGNGTLTISGTGSVSNISGFVGLSAGSTGLAQVSGGTWTNSGILRVGLDGNGTLDLTGGTVSATSVTLATSVGSVGTLNFGTGATVGTLSAPTISGGAGSALVNFDHTGTSTFSQIFSGSLAVGKLGSGTSILTGTSSYTGATTVGQGTLLLNGQLGNTALTVNSGATLGGTGTTLGNVTINSGGTFSPGNRPGIFNIGGNLTLNSGSISNFEINGLNPGTQYDQVQVTGSAALDGTLNLNFGFVPISGDRFTLVQAASFALNGDPTTGFASITNNLGAALLADVEIDPTTFDVLIALSQQDFLPFAGTPNQQAVAANLDTFSTSGRDQDLINALNLLSADQLPLAFDLIAPDELGAMADMTLANTRNVFGVLGNRIQEIKNGQQYSANGLAIQDTNREILKDRLVSTAAAKASNPQSQSEYEYEKRFGFFASGQGTYADIDSDGNGEGYEFSTGGLILGGDYRIGDQVTIGSYAGYQGSEANTRSSSKITSDSAKFGVYASYANGKGSWLSANVGGGVHRYDTDRTSLGGTARGDSHGTEINTQIMGGHDFKISNWTFRPEANLAYVRLGIDGFRESGSLAPLTIRDQNVDSLRSTLAAQVSYDWKIDHLLLRPYLRLGWQHECMDDQHATSARLASGAGGLFTVHSPEQARDSIVTAAGAQLFLSEAISIELVYGAEVNADHEVHNINGAFNFRF